MDTLVGILIVAVTGLIGAVWKNLNDRLRLHEDRMQSMDQTIIYLREQGHALRGLLPNPAEIEARRLENRDNFNQLFSMMREVEKRLNEINGELRAGRLR